MRIAVVIASLAGAVFLAPGPVHAAQFALADQADLSRTAAETTLEKATRRSELRRAKRYGYAKRRYDWTYYPYWRPYQYRYWQFYYPYGGPLF
jgi:hypothetical protein